MALKLDELLKKAKDKGYGASQPSIVPLPSNMIKTWQQESVLYSKKTVHKVDTNRTQGGYRKTQSGHKPNTQLNTKEGLNRTQTEHKLDTHTPFSSLVGLQRQTLVFLFQDCKLRGARCTQELTIQHIAESLEMPIGSLKTTLSRLEDKRFIKREAFKNGRGGWSRYELPNEVYRELAGSYIESKPNTNRTQTEHKPNTKVNTQPNTSSSSSSSNYNISTTTNQNVLPEDWDKIDFTDLLGTFKNLKSNKTQFFGKAQIKAIYASSRNKLTSVDVQSSINSLAYGLQNYPNEEPYKSMVNPAAILVDQLKNGDKWEEKKYLSPEEAALYKVYVNISKKVQEDIKHYYKKWKETDRDKKFAYYKEKMRSNEWFNDQVFDEKAWVDYEKNLWPQERKSILRDMLGLANEHLLDTFESIDK